MAAMVEGGRGGSPELPGPCATESGEAVPSTTMLFPEPELPTGARIFPSTLSEYPPCAGGGSWGPCATENRRGSAQHHRVRVLDSKRAVEEAEGDPCARVRVEDESTKARGVEDRRGGPRTDLSEEAACQTTEGRRELQLL